MFEAYNNSINRNNLHTLNYVMQTIISMALLGVVMCVTFSTHKNAIVLLKDHFIFCNCVHEQNKIIHKAHALCD